MATTTFKIQVVVDTKNAASGVKKAGDKLKGLRKNADQARVSIGRMLSVFLAFRAIRGTIRLIAGFEQSMSTVQAVTNATSASMALLTAEAQRLGATTRFTATQAADGLVLLSRAGFDVRESMSAVGDTLRLAQAGGLGLAQAAEITADTLRAFNIAAVDTARVTDVLAKASNVSNTTVSQLGQALKFVAPVARGLGVSLEETTAALAQLANAGQKASIGGTGLRRVMAALEAPTAKAQRVLAALGLSAEDVSVSAHGVEGAMTALATAGISTSEIFEIFGRRSGAAAQILVQNIGALEKTRQELDGAGGTAKKMAEIMDRNLNGAIFRSKSAIQAFGLALGKSGLSDALIGALEGVSAAFRFLADNIDIVGPAVTALATTIAVSVIPAAIGLIAKMGLLRASFLSVGAASGVLLGGLTLLIGEYSKLRAEIKANNETAAEEAKAVRRGAELLAIRKQLAHIEDRRRQGLKVDQLALLSLVARENELVKALREESRQAQLNNAARAASRPTVENTIARINRQIAALGDLTEQEKLSADVAKEVQRIRSSSQDPTLTITDAQKKLLGSKLQELKVSQEIAKVVSDIVGPEQELERRANAIRLAFEAGKLNAEQFAKAMDEVNAQLRGGGADQFAQQLQSLEQSNQELRLRTTLRGEELQLALAIQATGKSANELSAQELQDLATKVHQHQVLLGILKQQSDEQRQQEAAEAAAAARASRDASRQQSLLNQINLTEKLNQKRADAQALFDQGRISAQQLAGALDEVQLRGLAASTSLIGGFERAFAKMRSASEDLASAGESIVNVFAEQATDALIKFAETGKFKFKDFATAILKDIGRIIARLLVMQAITAVAGGLGIPGAAAAPAAIPARAAGGPVQKDRSYLVGENGPELFQPKTAGNIAPAGTTSAGQAAAPEVKVQVTNVVDPDEVPQAINDGGADDAIVNVISRNRDKIKGIL